MSSKIKGYYSKMKIEDTSIDRKSIESSIRWKGETLFSSLWRDILTYIKMLFRDMYFLIIIYVAVFLYKAFYWFPLDLNPQNEDQTKIYFNIYLMTMAYDAAMDFRVCVLYYSTS